MTFAVGQALRQQGGAELQSEVQRVAKNTTLAVSGGELSCTSDRYCACVTEWRTYPSMVCLPPPPPPLHSVALSGCGNLALCKHLIHVHSPQWDPVGGVDMLKAAVVNVLKCANQNKIKTVAFPSIASGS